MTNKEAAQIRRLLRPAIGNLESLPEIIQGERGNTKDLPSAFEEVAKHAPTVRNALSEACEHLQGRKSDLSCEGMEACAEKCKAEADHLQQMFEEVVPKDPSHRLAEYQRAVREISGGNRVETIMKSLMRGLEEFLGMDKEMRVATEVQLGELTTALREILRIPPSLPEERNGHNITNTGSGPQNIHLGTGNQYNHTTSGKDGKQYINCNFGAE